MTRMEFSSEYYYRKRTFTDRPSPADFEVLETATLPEMDEDFEVGENDHELVHELYEIWDNLNQSRMVEAWHDAQQIREEALDLFSHGIVDLKTRPDRASVLVGDP